MFVNPRSRARLSAMASMAADWSAAITRPEHGVVLKDLLEAAAALAELAAETVLEIAAAIEGPRAERGRNVELLLAADDDELDSIAGAVCTHDADQGIAAVDVAAVDAGDDVVDAEAGAGGA